MSEPNEPSSQQGSEESVQTVEARCGDAPTTGLALEAADAELPLSPEELLLLEAMGC
jgi:hypothetical protein